MKKILSIALIVALVATSAFAVSISGEADFGFGYDIDEKSFGFGNYGLMNQVKFSFGEEFFNETKEVKGEGDIYAGIKASLKLSWSKDMTVGKYEWAVSSADGFKTETTVGMVPAETSQWTVVAKIEEAYITDGVWKLNILGSKAASDYAKSAIDSWKADDKKTYYVSAVAPSTKVYPGFVFTMAGYTASLGLAGTEDDVNFNAMAETKEYNFNGAKVQAALVAGNEAATEKVSFGGSVKGNYTTEKVTVDAAADFAVTKVGDADAEFNMDAVAKAVGYGVTADAYFALDASDVTEGGTPYTYANENLLSAKVAYKTVIEGVEADVAFTGLDLINSQDLAASVSAKYGKVSGTVYAGYIVDTEAWKAGVSATYKADLYEATASADFKEDFMQLKAGVSSEKIVAGATLAAGYESGNLLADDPVVGTVSAMATIKF